MTRVVLHIGPHKTGTTYLQQRFVALRQDLRAIGFEYPEAWQDHLHGHHSLARALKAHGPKAGGALRKVLGDADTRGLAVLISSENLEGLDEPSLRCLAEACEGHAVEVVYAARRWSGLLPSAWQESVKQGSDLTYPEFLMTHLTQPEESDLLDYGRVLGRYASSFGEKAIRLLSYDDVRAAGRDLLDVFMRDILGANLTPPPDERRVNSSLPPFDIEIIRTLNGMAMRSGGKMPGGVWPMKLFYELGAVRMPAVDLLRQEISRWVRRYAVPEDLPAFRTIEARVLERHGPAIGALERGRLFGPADTPAKASHVHGEYWHDPAIPQAFAELRDAIQRRHRQAQLT